jgi:hypothetical protein
VAKTHSVVELLAFSLSFLSSTHPSLLDDVDMAFLEVFLGGVAVVLSSGGIFLLVMVGGDRGVAGPKELMGFVGAVTDGRAYSPPEPRFRRG